MLFIKKFNKGYFLRFRHDKSTREWQLFYQEQISELQKYLGDGIEICDVGCGLGSFLEICDKAGWFTYGIDISEYAIKEAKRRTKAKLAVHDIQDGIPFEEEFDVIACFDVVEHLENPEKALTNIYQKLKIGGILLLTTPNLRSKIWKRISGWQEDETHISLRKMNEWKECLRSIGFKIVCSKTVFPILSQKRGIKSLFGKLLAAIGLGSTLYILARRK
ncbi:class I SAM-dependent methyltransferase [Methanophagales archaeon]|nr:MAG: class I SAM-dependent methyltransferase [Methanophagales archaeon]